METVSTKNYLKVLNQTEKLTMVNGSGYQHGYGQ
jgi:hypothetical protein